jgi:hypothetical protein
MNAEEALTVLPPLEQALHRPEIRSDRAALARLLHPRFREFGRSGRIYDREEVLGEFQAQPQNYRVWSQDYRADVLLDDVVVLTYRSAHIENDGSLAQFTNRMSLWQLADCGWQVRFHQGTPCAPFARA